MAAKEIDMIRDAGVVGAGGAGFPTHVKLDASVDNLIINGAECEPLINVDKQLLEHKFDLVYKGIKIASELVGAKRIVLAVKGKNKKAIEAIEASGAGSLDLELKKLGDFYPAGDEQVLVKEVTGDIVPEGGIPLQVGSVVINVETLLNVAGAVEGKKVTHKFVTVNGEIAEPMTFMVPVGTPVKLLIDYCGGLKSEDAIVVDGGPMMGKLIDPENYAVKKTTKSIIAFAEDSIMAQNRKRQVDRDIKRGQAICLSCRMCTDLCPRYLLGHDLFPDELMKRLYKGKLTDEDIKNFDYAWLCCDCGLCELYACVVDLSARSIFNHLKGELARQGIKNPYNRTDLEENEFREFRKVPVSRLMQRLEVDKYDDPTPLASFDGQVDMVKLYLTQHVGAPSVPVVKEGDQVSSGDLVADIPEGKLGSRIHSSIEGKVAKIKKDQVVIEK